MKFGERLEKEKRPQWANFYIDYHKLKSMILDLETQERYKGSDDLEQQNTSLSIPLPTGSSGAPVLREYSQEAFFHVLEQEISKISNFTRDKVEEVRKKLAQLEEDLIKIDSAASKGKNTESETEALKAEVQISVNKVAEDFLQLEKFVNLNFTGFHKILKKHDRRLPSNPCKVFYVSRLHDQAWVRGDYSDVLVSMSKIYGMLRGDEDGEKGDEDVQGFTRTTTKYWVHLEDISRVKYTILKHLPVFLQSEMNGDTDSQLVNSVYLDNRAMELYHGRLDKTPNAIALRMRWYSTAKPETVFVERKTHRESWAGDVSVKERFIVPESEVLSVLDGSYNIEKEAEKMREKGKKPEIIKSWVELSSEILQVINTKQLTPTLRTQYMRTAFQIPFDATVRVSIDTNLTMISEITKETQSGARWYRDPSLPVPLDEITRFPHAVLEIKLCLPEGQAQPSWVTELIESGLLLQVHKFSKFIHGCAVLMPEDVTGMPYWIDDPTLLPSITQSGAASIVNKDVTDSLYQHMLPHTMDGKPKNRMAVLNQQRGGPMNARRPMGTADDEPEYRIADELCGSSQWLSCCNCDFASTIELDVGKNVPQKIEPKLILANERTFIKWLHMAVILSAISTGALSFSSRTGEAQYFALAMLPVSLLMIIYANWTYLWRCEIIKMRTSLRWDDPLGPVILTCILISVLSIQFILKLTQFLYPNM